MSFLALEPALVARLRERLPESVHVLTGADLADVAEGSQPTPAVHVVYQGYSADPGPMLTITQTWLTVIAVRQVASVRSGSGARADAGVIADSVLAALHRYRAPGYRPLQLTTAPRPGYRGGHLYLPLAWTTAYTETLPCE